MPIKKAKKRQNKKVLKYANHAGIPPYKLRLMKIHEIPKQNKPNPKKSPERKLHLA